MRLRHGVGISVLVLSIALLVVTYYLVKSCGTSEGRISGYLELLAAPVLAVTAVALLRFKPTGCWVALLVASPFIGWALFIFWGLQGEFAGSCGRF